MGDGGEKAEGVEREGVVGWREEVGDSHEVPSIGVTCPSGQCRCGSRGALHPQGRG